MYTSKFCEKNRMFLKVGVRYACVFFKELKEAIT